MIANNKPQSHLYWSTREKKPPFFLIDTFSPKKKQQKNVLHQTKQMWQFEAIFCPNCTVFAHIAQLLSGKAVSAVST